MVSAAVVVIVAAVSDRPWFPDRSWFFDPTVIPGSVMISGRPWFFGVSHDFEQMFGYSRVRMLAIGAAAWS
ncbi:hypothetical protein CSQ87_06550 [Bifidobacterium simiarum]|uniref:Uncharacterized protein n=1 Tax=Bifidobacterium simiarum TaxID=2045441 RepID=A0A2M9HEJ0_9BIFI|nr:hypothetical protein CSQ87_06550 [Bifidobacterium simiarum]